MDEMMVTVNELVSEMERNFDPHYLVFASDSGLTFVDPDTGDKYAYSLLPESEIANIQVELPEVPGSKYNPNDGTLMVGGRVFKEVKE